MIISASRLQVLEETLRFDYFGGGVTDLGYPHSTGWRSLPCVMTAHAVGGSVRVERPGGRDFVVAEGEAFCLLPGERHKADKITLSPSLSRWSHWNLSLLNAISIFSLLKTPQVYSGEEADRIGGINVALSEISLRGDLGLTDVLSRKSLGFQLAAILLRRAETTTQGAAFFLEAQRLTPALIWIEQHLSQPICREELASLIHLSPSRFSSVFREAVGVSLTKYLQTKRLQKAQQLLIGSSLFVGEIAAAVGYEDPFHFSRTFKREVGTSPTHYRENVRLNP